MVVAMSLLEACFFLLSVCTIILALAFGHVIWICYLNSFFILFMMAILVWAIPLNMNWSRNLYSHLLKRILAFLLLSIFVYAIEFWKIGINEKNGNTIYSFINSVYFSLTTWTTLGYSDFYPVPEGRLLAAIEAITGLLSIPLTASMIWLYCEQRMKSSSEDDQIYDGLQIQLDQITGLWKEIESENTLKEQHERDKKFQLNYCKKCSNSWVKIEKYYDIMGLVTPQAKYVVHCRCGNNIKPSCNAYIAYWRWNKKNNTSVV